MMRSSLRSLVPMDNEDSCDSKARDGRAIPCKRLKYTSASDPIFLSLQNNGQIAFGPLWYPGEFCYMAFSITKLPERFHQFMAYLVHRVNQRKHRPWVAIDNKRAVELICATSSLFHTHGRIWLADDWRRLQMAEVFSFTQNDVILVNQNNVVLSVVT